MIGTRIRRQKLHSLSRVIEKLPKHLQNISSKCFKIKMPITGRLYKDIVL